MILKKLRFYKNLIFFTLTISLLHIVLGLTSLFYFYSKDIASNTSQEKIESLTMVFERLQKKNYTLEDLQAFTQADIIDATASISNLPTKKQLTDKALFQQAKALTNIQSSLIEYEEHKNIALKVLIFSLVITFLFGWVLPGLIVKKLTELLIKFKNDLQTNIESIVLNWKNANLKDNQAAYLILSLQALSLYMSIRGDKTTTNIINEITQNLNRIFDNKNQTGI